MEYFGEDGVLTSGKVRIFDFDNPDANDWMVVNQFTVVAGRINRRPDVVVFVNGLPLAVVELKAPGDENATLSAAFNQLQTYKQQIPALFHTNAVLLTSDGMMARIGSLSADEERFMPWRTIDGLSVAPKGTPELSVLTEGVFESAAFSGAYPVLYGFSGERRTHQNSGGVSSVPCRSSCRGLYGKGVSAAGR